MGEVAKRLPDFNDELLVGYKKRNINSCPDYLREVFVAVTDHINMSVHGIHVDYVGERNLMVAFAQNNDIVDGQPEESLALMLVDIVDDFCSV